MNKKLKTPLVIGVIIALLAVTVSSAGCAGDPRTATILTATWLGSKPMSIPIQSGGFQVSGKLLKDDGSNAPLSGYQIVLSWSNDINNQPGQAWKYAITDNLGNYAFNVGSGEDQYLYYAVQFVGDASYKPSQSFIAGYRGVLYWTDQIRQGLKQQPDSVFLGGAGGRNALLAGLTAADLQIKYGKYAEAANTLNTKVLRYVDGCGVPSSSTGLPHTTDLIKQCSAQDKLYSGDTNIIAALMQDCRWLAGEPWSSPPVS